ncbi:MAG: hypothetical protein ACXWO3_18230 [Isosphaeraceae bacterium]
MSRHTGAVFYQVRDFDKHQKMFTVFADYHSEGLFSEQNAEAIMALAHERCGGKLERVRLDPAASARSGVGPAAASEYERTFGRIVGRWPIHQVADGLDQVELLLGSESKPPMLIIHPRCKHLIEGMKNYKRAERAGEYLDHPEDPQHPHEDLVDALRGAVRDTLPEGRKVQPNLRWEHYTKVL